MVNVNANCLLKIYMKSHALFPGKGKHVAVAVICEYHHLGSVKQKCAFENAHRVQIQIILHMLKVCRLL